MPDNAPYVKRLLLAAGALVALYLAVLWTAWRWFLPPFLSREN